MTNQIPMQPVSVETWARKYGLRTKEGVILERDMDSTMIRVAQALANVEEPDNRQYWFKEFLAAMRNGAIPGGRIMSNAGAEKYKPAASTINCTVSATIEDSMEGILHSVYEAGITLAAGCGIGYDFTTLRPRGAYVAGVGATTSGAVSFMGIHDAMCFTVASAGGRRGAQMGTLDIRHPDIEEFIEAKRTDGRLRQFNLSVLISDDFMRAVRGDKEWPLIFPLNKREPEPEELVWAKWPGKHDGYTVKEGKVLCRVYRKIKARDLWNKIMRSNYEFAEPGFILIDRYNIMNNNWFCEDIRATNPCGEQGLPPYGSCLLGSINLTKFVSDPFDPGMSRFDFAAFEKTVRVFTRMLDNVVELNALPLRQQREEIQSKRRHGMGFFGLGSAISMLGLTYGDEKSIRFTSEVSKVLAIAGLKEGVELAKKKGEAPILKETFEYTEELAQRNPDTRNFFTIGQSYTGRGLMLRSGYYQWIKQQFPDLWREISEHGIRFTHHSSIAPTGTMSLSFGNNASNGIEPSFSHHYTRNVIIEGRNTKVAQDVFSFEALAYKECTGVKENVPALPLNCVTAGDISPKDHIAIQAAAQVWIDSSISKTVNVPTDISFDDFQQVYMEGYESGCKGVSTFRFNPTVFQGVLVEKENLENTEYQFTLDDGSVVRAKGSQMIRYMGQEQTAANLFDAIKEGTFGRY